MASENNSIDPADAFMQVLFRVVLMMDLSDLQLVAFGMTTHSWATGDDKSDMALPQALAQVIDPDLIAGHAIGYPTSLQSSAVICCQLK